MTFSKQQLREHLRAVRHAISATARTQAAHSMCHSVINNLTYYHDAKNIALYWPNDEEIDTVPLLHYALGQHKNCFLPVLLLDNRQKLAFSAYNLDTPMVANRYGIMEPEVVINSLISLTDLDIIFVPLLGFDANGYRLGRGGGFYDATFSDLPAIPRHKWPKLVGLGYDCQLVENLPIDSWDWRLDAIVTEKSVLSFTSN